MTHFWKSIECKQINRTANAQVNRSIRYTDWLIEERQILMIWLTYLLKTSEVRTSFRKQFQTFTGVREQTEMSFSVVLTTQMWWVQPILMSRLNNKCEIMRAPVPSWNLCVCVPVQASQRVCVCLCLSAQEKVSC